MGADGRDVVVAVLPAAGLATRFPTSGPKHLCPIPVAPPHGAGLTTPLSEVLSAVQLAGCERAIMVLRPGAEAVFEAARTQLGDSVPLAAVYQASDLDLVGAVADAARWLDGESVALVLPDTVFRPVDSLARTVERLQDSGADVALGLFRTDHPHELCPVEVQGGRAVRLVDKPAAGFHLRNSWGMIAWTPDFTAHLARYVADLERSTSATIADVLNCFIATGGCVAVEDFTGQPDAAFVDVGTAQGHISAIRLLVGGSGDPGLRSPL